MKIVHIATSAVPVRHRFGGALQRRVMEMGRLQSEAGHEVAVLSPASHDGVETVDGVEIHSLHLRSRRPARDYEMLFRARQWVGRRRSIDVLHAHGAPIAATALRSGFSATVHSVDYFRYRGSATRPGHAYYAARLADFDRHLAASAFCADEFSRFYPRVADATRVLYNGVNRRQFRYDEQAIQRARRNLGLPTGPLVMYLGRVCAQKGSDLLAPLAAALRQSLPNVSVVAAGPPEQFARTGSSDLMGTLARAGVCCLGAVDETSVAGLLGAASVCVLPTRQDEMFGMAALEAIASGTPVVAADLGGIPEAVGPCAILFPPGDTAAFIDSVKRLLTDTQLAENLRKGGPQHVKRFQWSTIVDECMSHYAEVLR
jgi:glycosyltransferase involved in cell wall biosynthesis